jgi:hypothetical protein
MDQDHPFGGRQDFRLLGGVNDGQKVEGVSKQDAGEAKQTRTPAWAFTSEQSNPGF